MPIEMRESSKWWYGRFKVNKKRYCKNLGVKIAGKRPASLNERGNTAFERSRNKAEAALVILRDKARRQTSAEELVQTLHEIREGERVPSVPLSDMCEAWERIKRKRPLSQGYLADARSKITRFNDYLTANHPSAEFMIDVTHKMAVGFMKSEEDRGVSNKTWNDSLMLLRSVFKRLRREGGLSGNPFDDIDTAADDTVHRKPFTPEELAEILKAAEDHPFIKPIVITGICTAMRRGDCCMLEWSSVDMRNRFVTVRTSKTGEVADIPMLPLLHGELSKRRKAKAKSKYVFPKQAEMYQKQPVIISQRIRHLLADAGFGDKEDCDREVLGEVHAKRKKGLRRASIRDFHSFRVTWVTTALSQGVPLEVVQKVTGHKTAKVVQDNYFRPGRETFRDTLQAAMPALLMEGAPDNIAQAREIIKKMTQKTLGRDRKKLLELLPE